MATSGNSSDPSFTPAIFGLLPFAEEFARRGGDLEAILKKNRIPPGLLSKPTMLVDSCASYTAMEDMANLIGDPYMGARLAIEIGTKGTPAIRDAANNSTTFGGFLARLVVEFARQIGNVRYSFDVSHEATSLELRRIVAPRGATTQLDGLSVAFHVTMFKCGLGDLFDPTRIMVITSTTAGIPRDFLPKRSLLKSRFNGLRITFPPEWLWAPFSLDWQIGDSEGQKPHDEKREMVIMYFRSLLEEYIVQGDLSLSRFAEIVGLHPRRVQRILSANRMSFRQLKEEVRRGIALDLLSNTGAPVTEIASQVGFSDVCAFDRAFKQWTGRTPTLFRNKLKPESPQ